MVTNSLWKGSGRKLRGGGRELSLPLEEAREGGRERDEELENHEKGEFAKTLPTLKKKEVFSSKLFRTLHVIHLVPVREDIGAQRSDPFFLACDPLCSALLPL